MDAERLIHDFIDGTLESSEEDKLFLMLSNNDELKSEFKQQMAIKNAIRQDTKAFTPKAGTEAAIFGALGFSGAGSEVAPPPKAPKPSFWSRYSQAIFSGVAASLATFLLMFNFVEFGTDPLITSDQNILKQDDVSIPVVKSESVYDKGSNEVLNDKTILKTDKNNDNKLAESYSENVFTSGFYGIPLSLVADNEEYVPVQISTSDFAEIPISMNLNNRQTIPGISPANIKMNYEQMNIMLELNGTNYHSLSSGEMQPSQKQVLNNFGANIFYKINNEIKVGFGYQRENFYQKFIGIDNNGKVWEYEQQPNFQTFTLNFRYNPYYVSWNSVKPFVQAEIGGNTAGPVGRLMLGTEIGLNKYFNLTAGANYSIIGFHHQNRFFTSKKYGLYIGTGVNF